MDCKIGKEAHIQTYRRQKRQRDRHTDRHTDRQADKLTNTQADKHMARKTGR